MMKLDKTIKKRENHLVLPLNDMTSKLFKEGNPFNKLR